MAAHYWDTLLLTLSTDETGQGYVRVMYDKDELTENYNLLRERRFDYDCHILPEVIALRCSDLEFTFKAFYEGEEEFAQTFTLHLDESPEINIQIGEEGNTASLGLQLVNFDDPIDFDDEYDDDGRYDAWV